MKQNHLEIKPVLTILKKATIIIVQSQRVAFFRGTLLSMPSHDSTSEEWGDHLWNL